MSRVIQPTFDSLKSKLIRFGFAFYGEAATESPDPEKLILDVCSLFPEEIKVYKMLLTWMGDFGHLINVERLKHLLEKGTDKNIKQQVGLLILSGRQVEGGDKRFQYILESMLNFLKLRTSEVTALLKAQSDPYLIERYSLDPILEKIEVQSYKIETADRKKLMAPRFVIEQNLWLKLRILIGSNYRADVAYLRSLGKYKNKYQIWKALGSSQETAYRICTELDALGDLSSIELKG